MYLHVKLFLPSYIISNNKKNKPSQSYNNCQNYIQLKIRRKENWNMVQIKTGFQLRNSDNCKCFTKAFLPVPVSPSSGPTVSVNRLEQCQGLFGVLKKPRIRLETFQLPKGPMRFPVSKAYFTFRLTVGRCLLAQTRTDEW